MVVAFVGRLIPEKGIYSIIEAARTKDITKRDICFVLAGDGPLANEVKELVRLTCFGLGDVTQRIFPPYFSKQMCFVFQLVPKAFQRYFLKLQPAERLQW